MLKNKKILITGATGFIGSNLAKRLVGSGHEIHTFIRKSSNFWKLDDIMEKVVVHEADLSDNFSKIKRIVEDINPNGIFHLAASTIMSGVMASAEEVWKINFLGTNKLIHSLENIDYEFFVQAGSFSEYGLKNSPIKESERCEPGDEYGLSKLATTLLCRLTAQRHQKPIVTFRIFTPYGPFIQNGRLVYNALLGAMKGEPIKMTSPLITRDFIYVDDLVDLFIEGADRAGEYKGEIFNAASGEKTTLEEVIRQALVVTGSKSLAEWGALPNVSYDSDRWQADMTKTFQSFNWRPQTVFSSGMARTHSWLKENLHRYGETL